MKKYLVCISIFVVLVAAIFRNIWHAFPISGGDYIIFWPENILYLRNVPFFSWDSTIGLGSNVLGLMHEAPYNYFLGLLGQLTGFNTAVWERAGWWLPFFIFSFFSSKRLFQYLFPENNFWIFSACIFICNTYVFMMIGGGQIAGIGLGYAISPLVVLHFIKVVESVENKQARLRASLLAGFLFALQIMFDLRIAYITLLAASVYIFLALLNRYKNFPYMVSLLVYSLCIPLTLSLLLHLFWILPTVLFRVNTIQQLGPAFNSLQAVKFFSFATFENSFSLLHPNWPENIFGKIYFMRPEFLVLPLLAYLSLVFLPKKNTVTIEYKAILFFSLLGLLGAFLAKGANDPFGQVYLWLFGHVPGFIMFRDASKFYLLVALSYSMLIPFSIARVSQWLRTKTKGTVQKYIPSIVVFISAGFLLLIIRVALFGQLGGTFHATPVPLEYVQLQAFLTTQENFSRTLWVPVPQRFKFTSPTHPVVSGEDFFAIASVSGVLTKIQETNAQKLVEDAGIRYVIIPDDSEKEIFLKDHKYDVSLHDKTVHVLTKLPWLIPFKTIGKITLLEVIHPQNRFWILDNSVAVAYIPYSPVSYTVHLNNVKKGEKLIFSEAFDPYWTAKLNNITLSSIRYEDTFNSFVLPKDGTYSVTIYYQPQRYVTIGLLISIISTVIAIGYYLYKQRD